MVRRAPGSLLPLELDLLAAGVALGRSGQQFHGYAVAAAVADTAGARRLTSHGTLYKALSRLTERGLLEANWEDAAVAATDGRPRRRLYQVTASGELALAEARLGAVDPARRPDGHRAARRPSPGPSPA